MVIRRDADLPMLETHLLGRGIERACYRDPVDPERCFKVSEKTSCRQTRRDIVFFGDMDVDMIGMGPYIPHPETPLAAEPQPWDDAGRLRLGLNMIAATRLYLHDVNIAATTALQALAPDGREQGILAGANVMMPNVTDTAYRRRYQLYAGKPCLDENAQQCRDCLERRLAAIGERINYGARGDSAHFAARTRA